MGSKREQRISGKVHLRNQSRKKRSAKHREVNVRRTPRIVVIKPRIRSRLDGDEAVDSIFVGERASGPGKIRIQWRRMLIDGVNVTPRRIRLPQFNQRARNRTAVAVQHAPGHDNALAQWLTRMLTREIVVRLADLSVSINRAGDF